MDISPILYDDWVMNRVSRAILMVVGMMAFTGCAATQTGPTRPALINHVVFFKLNDPTEAQALIDDCDSLLAPISGVVSYYCGRHLDTGRGERVDSNYDVGLFVGFDSEATYSSYVEHPSHIELVTKWRPKLQWLRVYDVLDDTP